MNVLDLFSGIGGFSLGLERAGMRTVAFCEIDPWCRRVLAKHWPDVPIHEDVRSLRATDLPAIDVICGGFPCQDISVAGKNAGIGGERSGLWKEYARIIGEIRPRYIIVENVAALLSRGLADVLGDLAALGYDAEWHCIPASAVGAPHRRDRVWIVANTDRRGFQERSECNGDETQPRLKAPLRNDTDGLWQNVANTDSARLPLGEMFAGILRGAGNGHAGKDTSLGNWWRVEPDVGRVAHGIPRRVDRLRALGNAVVPQIPELIGRAIMRKK